MSLMMQKQPVTTPGVVSHSRHLLRRAAWSALVAMPLMGVAGAGIGLTLFQSSADATLRQDTSADAGSQVAMADELKQQAIGALKSGDFDETQALIDQALELRPDDSTLRQMNAWVNSFQEKRQEFRAERQEAFERQVKDVHLLQDNGYRSYAINAAAGAYLLAEDGEAFTSEPWVRKLIDESRELGEEYEQEGEWLRAMRVWGDLASIEELNPEWRDRLKGATRRVRLLAVYTPEILEELRDSTQAERDAVDKLLADDRDDEEYEVAPATEPSADAEEGDAAGDGMDETFRTDWRDAVEGINLGMLREALQDANQFYVKPVEFREMLLGGIDAITAVATTRGLERAFPALEDEAAKERLLTYLKDKRQSLAESAPESVGSRQLSDLLTGLRMINSQTIQLEEEVLVSEFADGALATLDPFSNMIWPSQLAEFTKGTQGEFVGVGIQIRAEENGDLLVVSPLPDSPAYEAGIQPNDVITHINGRSAKGITDTQAVTAITGEPGTKVTLTIKSVDGTVEDHELARRQINVTSVKGWKQLPGGKWDYFVDPGERIAYLRLTNFQKSTSEELRAAIDQMERQGSRGVILDLRYNPGGLLQSAVDVSDAFLGNAVIVSTRGDRPTEVIPSSVHRAKTDRDDLSLPLVVLVNEYSASASEIVSGALKDHERALIVGKRTFGKGSVQMLYRLRTARGMPEALLKLTTAYYYLPNGKNIHKEELDTEWGVDPDVPVEMTPQQMRDAISARQALDVLREDGSNPEVTLAEDVGPVNAERALLDSDAQLSAAILLLRMELAGEGVL